MYECPVFHGYLELFAMFCSKLNFIKSDSIGISRALMIWWLILQNRPILFISLCYQNYQNVNFWILDKWIHNTTRIMGYIQCFFVFFVFLNHTFIFSPKQYILWNNDRLNWIGIVLVLLDWRAPKSWCEPLSRRIPWYIGSHSKKKSLSRFLSSQNY